MVERILDGREDFDLHACGLVACGSGFLSLVQAALDSLEVFEKKFVVDDFLVAYGVDGTVDVGDIVVVEAAEDMYDGVSLADIGEEFVAETLTFRCSLDQTGDVDYLDCSRYD